MSQQPVPGTSPPESEVGAGNSKGPLFGLAPDGVFRASALALGAVGFYPTFSPLPVSLAKPRRFKFLWHCPSAGLAAWPPACIPDKSGLRSIAPCGVRTFLPQLAPGAVLHPSKITANLVWYLRNSYTFVALKLAFFGDTTLAQREGGDKARDAWFLIRNS